MYPQEYSCFGVLTGLKRSDLRKFDLKRGRGHEKVDGDCFGAGTGAGTVQRELGGGI